MVSGQKNIRGPTRKRDRPAQPKRRGRIMRNVTPLNFKAQERAPRKEEQERPDDVDDAPWSLVIDDAIGDERAEAVDGEDNAN